MKLSPIISIMVASSLCLVGGTGRADIFTLKSGGEIRGLLVNVDEESAAQYIVRPFSGGEIAIDHGLVARVFDQKPLIEDYERVKWQHPDTVDGNWEIAEWCREHRLKAERNVHLERILELDGEHRQTRRLLRYSLVGGVWQTRDQIELAKGKVKVNGVWRFPEDIELEAQREENKKQRRAWFKTINRWDSWLDTDRAEQAKANILEVKDPVAVDALKSRLENSKNLKIKKVYSKALASIGSKAAVDVIVTGSIEDTDADYRAHCFDMIDVYKPPVAFDMYVMFIKGRKTTNRGVNRAAVGLKYLEDKRAVPILIDRLITIHRVKKGNGVTGSTSATFGQGGSSKGAGFGSGQPTVKKKSFKNDSVLDALVSLTDKDFGFSRKAWLSWYAKYKSENKGPRFNPRRD